MDRPFVFFSIISFILLATVLSRAQKFTPTRTPIYIKNKFDQLTLLPKNTKALFVAINTGYKKRISKKLRTALKENGLMHLLTPSGLHFSSLLLFLRFLPRKILILLLSLLFLGSFWMTGFSSIKRVITFFLLQEGQRKLRLRPSLGISFGGTFILDVIFGHFLSSPLSSIYSFLFWGTILFHRHRPKLFIKLFLGLLITQYFSAQKVHLCSLLLNPLLTLGISAIFPFLFLNFYFLFFDFQQILVSYPLIAFEKIVTFFQYCRPLVVTVDLWIHGIFFLFFSRFWWRPWALILLLLLKPMEGSPPKKLPKRTSLAFFSLPPYKESETKWTTKGIQITSQKRKCLYELHRVFPHIRCRERKLRDFKP